MRGRVSKRLTPSRLTKLALEDLNDEQDSDDINGCTVCYCLDGMLPDAAKRLPGSACDVCPRACARLWLWTEWDAPNYDARNNFVRSVVAVRSTRYRTYIVVFRSEVVKN